MAIILLLIAFFLLLKKSKKKDNKKQLELKDLLLIAQNQNSTSDDILLSLKLFNENFFIDDNKEMSFEFFNYILNHKNINKEVFQFFHKEIKTKNKNYQKDLDVIERKALG